MQFRRQRFAAACLLTFGVTLGANGKEEAPSVILPKPVVLQPTIALPPPPAPPAFETSLAVKKPSPTKKAHTKKPGKKPTRPPSKSKRR